MRSSSASKKHTEYQRYLESRVLISSNSLNPLSKQISSKLDLIKQQLSRQFHEKYPTEKKRTTSTKKNRSASKIKPPEAIQKKLGEVNKKAPAKKLFFNPVASPRQETHQNVETQTIRDKYYELQDKLLFERDKALQNGEQLSTIKQRFMQFLEEPSLKTADALREYYSSERQRTTIQKIISLSEDVQFAETTLNQMMVIMEVQDIQSLLNDLRSKQTQFRNLNECSYRIMELETSYNKLQEESLQKIENLVVERDNKEAQMKEAIQLKRKEMESILVEKLHQKQMDCKQFVYQTLSKLQKQKLRLIEDQPSFESRDLFHPFDKKKDKNQNKLSLTQYSIAELLIKIEEVFQEVCEKIQEIGREAEENMQQFVSSKGDLSRLESLIEKLTEQMNEEKLKMTEQFQGNMRQKQEALLQQKRYAKQCEGQHAKQLADKNQEIQTIKHQCLQKDRKAIQIEKQINLLQQKIQFRDNKLCEIIQSVKEALDPKDCEEFNDILEQLKRKEQVHEEFFREEYIKTKFMTRFRTQIDQHLLTLRGRVQEAENMSAWNEKELQVKQNILRQYDYNLKRMMEDIQGCGEREKRLIFQRDQYKYLLNNLREKVIEMKKQNEDRISRIIKEKDQQYLTSNQDILKHNERIEKELSAFKTKASEAESELKTERASHTFFKRKTEQLENTLSQNRKRLMSSESEIENYKKLLSEIEVSFRQLEGLSEINSRKLSEYEQQNNLLHQEAARMRVQLQEGESIRNGQCDEYAKLKYAYEEVCKKNKALATTQDQLECQNSELRVKQLEHNEKLRQTQKEISKLKYENNELLKVKTKAVEEINTLTSKLLSKIEKSKQQGRWEALESARKQTKELISEAKREVEYQKNMIKDYLTECQVALKEEGQHICEAVSLFENHYEKESLLLRQKVSESVKEENNPSEKRLKTAFAEISRLRGDIQELSGYQKIILSQFESQLSCVRGLMKKVVQYSQKQEQINDCNYGIAYRIRLHLHSLKNQMDQFKLNLIAQLTRDQTEFKKLPQKFQIFLKQFTNLSNKILKDQDESDDQGLGEPPAFRQKSLKDSFRSNEQEDGALEVYLSQRKNKRLHTEEGDFQSPQFKKIMKSCHSQETERQNADGRYQFRPVQIQIDAQEEKPKRTNLMDIDSEARRVHQILESLKEPDNQPTVSYFSSIRQIYREIKKKLNSKSLNLDLSGVSFRPHTQMSSPSSVSNFNFLFERKQNGEPLQQGIKESHRSDLDGDKNTLRQRIEQLEQQLSIMAQREDSLRIQISDLEKKNTELQNEFSQKVISQLFLRFLKSLFEENCKEIETSCRTMLKMMKISGDQIRTIMQNLEQYQGKRKKKSSSGFMGLFNNG